MQVLFAIFKGLLPLIRGLGRLFFQQTFLILLLVIVSGGGLYLFFQNRSISNQLSLLRDDPSAVVREGLETLIENVGELTQLPEDEQPTVATVTDVESIKNQSFFQNAQNGDRVLIYSRAKRAILYRPETGKIVEIAPININQTEGLNQDLEGVGGEINEVVDEEPEKTVVRLALANGTPTAGLTGRASNDLVQSAETLDLIFVSETDAAEDYERTIVVPLSEGMEGIATQVALFIGGDVGGLPEGESTPEADILVILGSNYSSE